MLNQNHSTSYREKYTAVAAAQLPGTNQISESVRGDSSVHDYQEFLRFVKHHETSLCAGIE